MVQVIVTGHGNFASGMLSALKVIAGVQEHIHGVDFEESLNTADLKKMLQKLIESAGEEVLIATDLVGGSPYNVAVLLMSEITDKKIKVVAGINFPMLLSAAFADKESGLETFLKTVLEEGQRGFSEFRWEHKKKQQDEEDGI